MSESRRRFTTMRRSRFWTNVVTVLAGAIGAQALPLLAAPLLTRMCTPADLGDFSVWLGVIALTSIAATLRIDTAMVLDRGGQQQRLCFGVVAYAATLVALALTLFGAVAGALDLPATRTLSWVELLTLGAGTWLTANLQTTLAYATSHERFRDAAKAKLLQAGTIAASQLVLLRAGLEDEGLMAGQLLGLAAGLYAARRLLAPPTPRIRLRLDTEQKAYLVKHGAFWRFSLPSSLLNAVVGQLPLFMIGLHHGAHAAGLFALTQRVLSAPVALVAASVLEVFKREAAQEFEASGHCSGAYRKTLRALLLLAVGPSLVLLLFSPQLFSWIFGPAWRPAGELAQLLAPLYFLNFLASPLSYVFFVAGKQKAELRWQVALFLITVAVFAAPLSLRASILAYALGRSTLYVIYLGMSYWFARGPGTNPSGDAGLPARPKPAQSSVGR